MMQLKSYLAGVWHEGQGEPTVLVNPANESAVAQLRSVAVGETLAKALAFARDTGGPNLRALSMAERGKLLKALAKLLHEQREELLALSVLQGGNTRGDAKFDVDGAIGVLATYAHLSKDLGERSFVVEGEALEIARGSKIRAQHVLVPRHGVAIQINAFNFPAWGMVGKLAVALLAGMPVLSKPATSTAAVAARIAEIIVESNLLPEGAFSLLLGPVGDLLDHVRPQDVIAFTGSAETGAAIRGHANVLRSGARVNVEADSLNAAILGPDVGSDGELFDLFVRDCVIEMTQKAGQKCTATRRILVPSEQLEAVRDALADRLAAIAQHTGDPSHEGVRMGPLATGRQLADARKGLASLQRNAERVFGDPERDTFVGSERGKGFFLEPVLLQATAEAAIDPNSSFHHTEVFGPVATLLPYDGTLGAARRIVAAGEGSLVGTVYSDDREFAQGAVLELGPHLGRLVLANEKSAGASVSPGCVFPVADHGGPGRAGSGAELGGLNGLSLYMQRMSIQAAGSQLARVLDTKG